MLKNKMMRFFAFILVVCLIIPVFSLPVYAEEPEAPDTSETTGTEQPYTFGTYEETVSSTALYCIPLHYDTFMFEQKDARLKERLVDNGSTVQAGDALFTYTRVMSAAPLEEAKLLLERTKLETEEGIAQREKDIEKQENATILNGYDQRIQAIRLEQMQADLTLYEAQQNRLIEQYQKECDELQEEYETRTYYAEASGIVFYQNIQQRIAGDLIESERIQIADPASYRVVLSSSTGFRYGMEVTIEFGIKGNRQTVTGRIVAGDNLLAMENVSLADILDVYRDDELYVIDIEGIDLSQVMENPYAFSSPVVTGIRKYEENVGLLLRQYVKNENGRYYVTIEENNSHRRQYLHIAASDITYVWVVAGLTPDDRIQKR